MVCNGHDCSLLRKLNFEDWPSFHENWTPQKVFYGIHDQRMQGLNPCLSLLCIATSVNATKVM